MALPTLKVELEILASDKEERAELSKRLQRELLQLQVESVDTPHSAPPAGAKAGAAQAIGELAVTLAPVLLPKLLDLLQHWSKRGAEQRVRVKTSVGDRSFEVEFPAGGIEPEELRAVMKDVQQLVRTDSAVDDRDRP